MDSTLREREQGTAGDGSRQGEPDPEFVWRQYNLWIDLYKFHMELLLKANTFFYLITGGILTFYLAHPEQKMLRFSLVLPIVIGVALAATFFYGMRFVGVKRREVQRLGSLMNCGVPPDVNALPVLLLASAIILSGVVFALVGLVAQWFTTAPTQ